MAQEQLERVPQFPGNTAELFLLNQSINYFTVRLSLLSLKPTNQQLY